MINLRSFNDQKKLIESVIKELNEATEKSLTSQLNELVSLGLLRIEETEPVLVTEPFSQSITIRKSVRLVLKDKEYILKLQEENKCLKYALEALKEALDHCGFELKMRNGE